MNSVHDPILEIQPRLYGEKNTTAYRARIIGRAPRIKPGGDTPRAYRMVAGKAHLRLDDTGLGAKRAAFCEADDAAFAAVGPYAVLDCQQQAEECLRHCGRLRGSFDGEVGYLVCAITGSSSWEGGSARDG